MNEIIDESVKYLLLDDKGMIIEQSKEFNDKTVGDICDIIHRSKKISKENEILIAIQFEKNNLVISNDINKKLSVCSLTNKSAWKALCNIIKEVNNYIIFKLLDKYYYLILIKFIK